MGVDLRISYASARHNCGLSQKEACKILGISEKTLIAYENGKTIPRWDNHCKMAKLYGIPKECLCPPNKDKNF
ncbi:helix-turn-helix transcriptional regulator [Clostridium sp. C1]|uniref:helix-turn-helix transcriptional regulator n=1 Tax=Clostridium sp. C1 TaxID=1155388 RepID=UPI001BAC7653|nr:helix-turn-helix transcriptional regulator [Clostridium sp. C1]QUN13558.1 helix-turn-helix transcriptional regulator [Clostridium sp. C1]